MYSQLHAESKHVDLRCYVARFRHRYLKQSPIVWCRALHSKTGNTNINSKSPELSTGNKRFVSPDAIRTSAFCLGPVASLSQTPVTPTCLACVNQLMSVSCHTIVHTTYRKLISNGPCFKVKNIILPSSLLIFEEPLFCIPAFRLPQLDQTSRSVAPLEYA
jgi:hypothetical protein